MASACAYTCACCRDRDDRLRDRAGRRHQPGLRRGRDRRPRRRPRAAGLPQGRPGLGRRHAGPRVLGPHPQHQRRPAAGGDQRRRRQRHLGRDRGDRRSPATCWTRGLRVDIAGWRKNLARTAAFYFTELPDSYAARTGRPDHVGVIGVAVFRERVAPVPGKIGQSRANEADGAGGPAAYPSASAPRRDAATGEAAARDAAGSGVAEQKAQEAVAPDARAARSRPPGRGAPLYAPAPPRRRPSSAPGTAATRLRTRRWWRSSATARSRRR